MGSPAHLVRRFFGSLLPWGPRRRDRDWVATLLTPAELALWQRMKHYDRRHGVAVARRVERALGNEASRDVLVAALLHDVGKVAAGLGLYGRVVATLSAKAAGAEMADEWSAHNGIIRKVGLYVRHAELGGDMLGVAESSPLVVTWAREHHLPEDQWTIDARIGTVLKSADDD